MENEDVSNKIQQPITTRWWWLGISYGFGIKYWKVYVRIVRATVNIFESKLYGNIVA